MSTLIAAMGRRNYGPLSICATVKPRAVKLDAVRSILTRLSRKCERAFLAAPSWLDGASW
jgi:hypothetical protein